MRAGCLRSFPGSDRPDRIKAMLIEACPERRGFGTCAWSELRGAVAEALKHAEVSAPRAHRLAVLMGHNSGDLVQMR